MKAPKTRKLMMLSSTISTLMGGTELSSIPGGKLGASTGLCFFVGFFPLTTSGFGEDTRGVGGVEFCRKFSSGGGGVGIGAVPDAVECFVSDAEESCRIRWVGRLEVADCVTPPVNVVGEAVLCRPYLGRLMCGLLPPPGEGSGAI